MSEINAPKPFRFLSLPLEIRAVIYKIVFESNGARVCVADSDTPWDEGETLGQLSRIVQPPITSTVTLGNEPLLVCKQLYAEAGPAFRANAVFQVQEHMLLWDKKQTLRALVDLKAIQITSEYEQSVTVKMVTSGSGQSHLVVQGDIFHPFVRDLDQLDSVLDRVWVEAEDSSNESNPVAVTSRREDNLNLWNTPYSEDFHLGVQKSLLEVVRGVKSVTTILWTKSMVLNLGSGRNPISTVVLSLKGHYDPQDELTLGATEYRYPSGELIPSEHGVQEVVRAVRAYVREQKDNWEGRSESRLWQCDADDAYGMMRGLFDEGDH